MKCADCRIIYAMTEGTIFKNCKLPLMNILYSIIEYNKNKKISSYELGRLMGFSQKTAYYLLKKIKTIPNEILIRTNTINPTLNYIKLTRHEQLHTI